MKTRRTFLKHGLVWIPFAPMIARSQVELSFLATKPAAVGGGGGCTTTVGGFTDATNGEVNAFNDVSRAFIAIHWLSPGTGFTLCGFAIDAYKASSPTMTVTPYIYSNSTNTPGTLLTNGTGTAVNAADFSASDGTLFKFTGFNCSISANTPYWLVMGASGSDAGNFLRMNVADGSWPGYNSIKYGTAADTWAGGSNAQVRNQPYSA